ncbi:oligopeptide ABC transporter substrate-binding protein [Virgibacillus dakarensis]|nr:oligopeptide ABC transporter substrate-binding protein [Virgibacillus dakarensis]
MKKTGLLVTFILFILFGITACTDNRSSKVVDEHEITDNSNQAATKENTNKPKSGGTITFAASTPFDSLLERGLFEHKEDELILNFISDSLVDKSDSLELKPGMADYEVDENAKTVTFTIKDGIKWHDGTPLTSADIAFAYEVIAHPDYTGLRYANVSMIEGAQRYHEGKADGISGIDIVDDKTITIKLTDIAPNTMSMLWSYPMPKHYYKDIPIKKLAGSNAVSKNPIGTGPFKVTNIVPGKTVKLEKFNDYWRGEPYLDGITFEVIDDSQTTEALKNGKVDIMAIPDSKYKDVKALDNVILNEEISLEYSYIGFKLGHWDKEKEVNIMDNHKFQNKKLRQAMAYALDRQGILDSFYNGLGELIEAPIHPASWASADESELTVYNYDPEKARKLLDEAGYKDIDGDKWREDPEGKKFTINFDAASGYEISKPRTNYIIKNWQDVGLNVRLNGDLKELNLFYDVIEHDESTVELFYSNWDLTSDPDPTGLWRSADYWNFSRWVNKESDELIEEGLSDKAFDEGYRKEVYVEWQKLINKELPNIFLYAPADVYAVNKRLQNVHTNAFTSQVDTHLWWVTDGKE